MKTILGLHSRRRLVVAGSALILMAAGAAQAADSPSADEQKLREVDAAWAAAAVAKDVDKTVSYYAESAVVFAPNAPALTTKEAIRTAWKEMLVAPGAALSWKATKVEVSKSGDLGYVSGTYEAKMNDPSGKPVTERGKFVEILKKQADGSWKCVVDIWNSDTPVATAAETK